MIIFLKTNGIIEEKVVSLRPIPKEALWGGFI
jgi:hypothetical protein